MNDDDQIKNHSKTDPTKCSVPYFEDYLFSKLDGCIFYSDFELADTLTQQNVPIIFEEDDCINFNMLAGNTSGIVGFGYNNATDYSKENLIFSLVIPANEYEDKRLVMGIDDSAFQYDSL